MPFVGASFQLIFLQFQAIVTELLLFYSRNRDGGVRLLIKFCVDVCGFQNFSIATLYKFTADSSGEIVNLMKTREVVDQNPKLQVSHMILISIF